MKKYLLVLLIGVICYSVANGSDSLTGEHKAIYDALVKKDWNGFDGKGSKAPASKLVFKGTVDFPYYPGREWKMLKKNIRIYKYDKPFPVSIIPIDKLDYKSTPEMALLSLNSDYRERGKADIYWNELNLCLEKKIFPKVFYKIVFTVDKKESVSFLNTFDWPMIFYFDANSSTWLYPEEISYTINLDFAVIYENLRLMTMKDAIQGKLEFSAEQIENKVKQIVENKLPAVEDEGGNKEKELEEFIEGLPDELKNIDWEILKKKEQLPPEELKKIDEELKNPKKLEPQGSSNGIEFHNSGSAPLPLDNFSLSLRCETPFPSLPLSFRKCAFY